MLSVGDDFRYCGQAIFYTLMTHQLFDRTLRKHGSAKTVRDIQPKLDTLRSKVSWPFIFFVYILCMCCLLIESISQKFSVNEFTE